MVLRASFNFNSRVYRVNSLLVEELWCGKFLLETRACNVAYVCFTVRALPSIKQHLGFLCAALSEDKAYLQYLGGVWFA